MPSARSWFNLTLFKKNLTRFWPIWGTYLVIWLFAFPVVLILQDYNRDYFADRFVLLSVPIAGVLMSAFFAILAAMAVWSYLYNHRSVSLMHTLPIRREGLFLTNYLSGLAFFVGPNLVIFLLTGLGEASYGVLNVTALVSWLVSMTLLEVFFFSFATFCAVFTGHLLCLPVFYGVLNFLVVGMLWLVDMALSRFVFGYTGVTSAWNVAQWLTPVWKLIDELYVSGRWGTPWLENMGYIIVYAFLGLVMAAVALLIYRRRELERSGDVVAVSWVRPIFQYGVGFCVALAFGSLLFSIFRGALPDTAWTLLFFLLMCGTVGFFAARMLLEKSFRVFRKKTWGLCGCLLAALVILVCVMEFDLTGFERRVPRANQVASVSISGVNSAPRDSANWLHMSTTDPAVIEQIVALHQAVVDQAVREELFWSHQDWYMIAPEGYEIQEGGLSGFYITYKLSSGKTISRDYDYQLPITRELLADPDSYAAQLNALLNMPQVVIDQYGLSSNRAELLTGVAVYNSYDDRYSYTDGDTPWLDLTQKERTALYDAVLADIRAGNLGRRYLLDDKERMENNYTADLEFTFLVTEAGIEGTNPDGAPLNRITIGLQTTAVNTLAALEHLGVDTKQFETQAERRIREYVPEWYEKFGESWQDVLVGTDGA